MASGHRLPTGLRPVRYTLEVAPDLEKFTFEGKVTMELEVDVDGVGEIVCHAAELTHKATSATCNGAILALGEPAEDKDRTTWTWPVAGKAKLSKGQNVSLSVEYSGILNDKMCGFYRSSYTNLVSGEARVMATTQFEAIDARQALPCWDEPAFKAVFEVTVVAPKGTTALGNMPVAEEKEDPATGKIAYTFDPTPKMSTYLLAFIVGEFEHVEASTERGVQVRVHSTPGHAGQGDFALSVACKALDFFSDFFGIDYVLPKCDMVAIADFAAGAMENWGLVTYREAALLVDEAKTSAAAKQRVAYVVCHELAHQWFGNLVTMAWWNDLWLNEGFATWVGWLAVDSIFPDWQVWRQFVANDVGYALRVDALASSHPIEAKINDPKEITQIFDGLSYQKGAAVIRLLEARLGSEKFKAGMQLYLDTFRFGNAETADLWAAHEETSRTERVADLMKSWTGEMGFPVLRVENARGGILTVSQARFLASGADESCPTIWHCPIKAKMYPSPPEAAPLGEGQQQGEGDDGASAPSSEPAAYVVEERTLPTLTMKSMIYSAVTDEVSAEILEHIASGKAVQLNAGQTVPMRVLYTPGMLSALAAVIRDTPDAMDPIDRLGLLSDSFALTKAGMLSAADLLGLVSSYVAEVEYPVVSQLTADLADLDDLLASACTGDVDAREDKAYELFRALGRKLYKRAGEFVGWEKQEGEGHLTAQLRPMVLKSLGQYGDPAVVATFREMFAKVAAEGLAAVNPDLAGSVLGDSIAEGGEDEFTTVVRLYKEETVSEVKVKMLMALGRTRDTVLAKRLLDWAFYGGDVRGQDLLYVLAGLSSNRHCKAMQWAYVKEHWGTIVERYAGAHGMIRYFVSIPLRGMASEEAARDVEEFFKANPVPEASMALSQGLEGIRNKATWLRRDGPAMFEWLEANKGDMSGTDAQTAGFLIFHYHDDASLADSATDLDAVRTHLAEMMSGLPADFGFEMVFGGPALKQYEIGRGKANRSAIFKFASKAKAIEYYDSDAAKQWRSKYGIGTKILRDVRIIEAPANTFEVGKAYWVALMHDVVDPDKFGKYMQAFFAQAEKGFQVNGKVVQMAIKSVSGSDFREEAVKVVPHVGEGKEFLSGMPTTDQGLVVIAEMEDHAIGAGFKESADYKNCFVSALDLAEVPADEEAFLAVEANFSETAVKRDVRILGL